MPKMNRGAHITVMTHVHQIVCGTHLRFDKSSNRVSDKRVIITVGLTYIDPITKESKRLSIECPNEKHGRRVLAKQVMDLYDWDTLYKESGGKVMEFIQKLATPAPPTKILYMVIEYTLYKEFHNHYIYFVMAESAEAARAAYEEKHGGERARFNFTEFEVEVKEVPVSDEITFGTKVSYGDLF